MKKSISKDIFLKLKPGDKLLVNRNLAYINDTYGIPYGIVDDMEELEGKVVTVKELYNSPDESKGPFVIIKEDRWHYAWAPECFEKKVEESFPDCYAKVDKPLSTMKKGKTLSKVLDDLSKKWDKYTPEQQQDIADYFAGRRTVRLEVSDNTAKIATYDFSYSPDGKVVCRDLATKETATARCHEEDIFSVEVGQLVSFAHMLGFDVDYNENMKRLMLVRKRPAYSFGDKVCIDENHPDCPKCMKESYKDEIGLVLSSELDRKLNTFVYKVLFKKDEQIFKLRENILKDEFYPGIILNDYASKEPSLQTKEKYDF